jgi:hypothetical protein
MVRNITDVVNAKTASIAAYSEDLMIVPTVETDHRVEADPQSAKKKKSPIAPVASSDRKANL